ncbi:hypothetical protein BCV72DRAFT_217948 [Rhizopus microsporus var. microsporus]|uniref:Uncharacterized protein n=1 Tax=Rhizopus microsporus var. microsporus TaxID=86635 RepID=A0A1X0QMX1_RHIZD|nr:hypothetical protein BCV72DRAFT_217948 [Rhizopus microsporus var. microsporus]
MDSSSGTNERWRTKKQSITQRHVDKELQRIKSLAVVSVLNKAFEDPNATPTEQQPQPKNSEKRQLAELQDKYEDTLKELSTVKSRSEQQSQLLMMQGALIEQLSEQIEYLTEENQTLRAQQSVSDVIDIRDVQREIIDLRQILEELNTAKDEYEMMAVSISDRLEESEVKMEDMEQSAKELKKQCQSQSMYIEAKVETLINQLKEKDEVVNKMYEQKIKQMYPKYTDRASARSSVASKSSQQRRRSHIARWKGVALPPASPPPSAPLPPIPSTSSSSRLPVYKHMSVDAVGGPQSFSSLHELDKEISDAMYYKEFTDQLQARLSVSKEIDDLQNAVWKPSDYDEIQRKIESKNWLDQDVHPKDQSAFWKGMKKKLRV